MVAGGQVVVLYSNHCMGIGLGGLIIGRPRRVVVLKRWCISRFDCILFAMNLTV